MKRYFSLTLLITSIYCFGQSNGTDSIVLKSDTTFHTQVINGHSRVVREISIYDTLYLVESMAIRDVRIARNDFEDKFNTKSNNLFFPEFYNVFSDVSLTFGYSHGFSSTEKQQGIYNVNSSNVDNYSISGIYNCNVNNWVFSTGLGLKYSTQNFEAKYNQLSIDTTFTWKFSQHDTSFVDTIKLLDISQLPDTVYIIKLVDRDSVVTDSIKNYKYDSVYNKKVFVNCNRYYYFELPLIFGYSFRYRRFLFTPQVGGVFSWLTKSYVYSIEEDGGIKYFESKDFSKFALDAYLGCRIKYEFNNLNGIVVSPYIRYSIIEEFSNECFVGNKNIRFGIRIGYLFSLF